MDVSDPSSPGSHILIVDDVAENIQLAITILREDSYEFSFASNGAKALEIIEANPEQIDLILLDVMMPGMDGFQVCKALQARKPHNEIPIIFLTARSDVDSITQGLELGAVDYVTKPFHAAELLARVKVHTELRRARKLLALRYVALETKAFFTQERLLAELNDAQKELIWTLTEVMEANSDETGKHIRRIAEHSALLARLHPALTDDDAELLYHASPMHDVGKMTMPQEILHKPGSYTPEEFETMKSHATNGYQLLANSKRRLTKAAAIIAHEHHEKWDGSGYPRGLIGSNIHIYGRVVALADVLDALTHRRCYKPAWTPQAAKEFIVSQRAKHFDPELVDLMVEHWDEFVRIIDVR